MNEGIDFPLKQEVLKRDNYICQKCGYKDSDGNELEAHHINPKFAEGQDSLNNLITLCSICHHYAPDSPQSFQIYINEKIDGNLLNTFRKSNRSISKRTKFGMERKAHEGGFITKAPKGYVLVNKQLQIQPEEAEKVQKIFNDFLTTDISLTQLAKNNSLSTSGIKKLLQNTTYLGKVKYDDVESQGTHPAIIDEELFKRVQEKL